MIKNISNGDSIKLNSCIDRLNTICNYKTAAFTISKLFLEKDKKIVIYGAGLHTKKLFEYFDKNYIKNIVAIADGNKAGSGFCGFNIINTDEIKNLEFDFIVLSSDVNQINMTKELLNHEIDNKKIIDIYKQEEFYNFCKEQNNKDIDLIVSKINSSKNPLVITGLAFQLNHLSLFDELSKHFDLFVFCINDRLSQSLDIGGLQTKYTIKRLENISEIFYLVNKIAIGKILTIHGCRDVSFSASVIKNANVDVFCMVIDVLSSMFANEDEAAKLFSEKARDDWFCEKICWNYSSGFIHKDEPSVLKSLINNFGKKESLQFLNYCTKKTVASKSINFENPKFVYAGGIHAASDKNDGSAIQNSVLDIAKNITNQGYEFHIYNAYDDGSSGKWGEFVKEVNVNKNFFYNTAINPDKLVDTIAKFDIAISVFDFSNRLTKADFHIHAFPTRLIAFIEAGLPIILSNELKYAVSFIEKLGIGTGVDLDEIDDIKSLLKKFDKTNFKDNATKALHELSYKNNIHKLIDFMNRENR